MRNWEFKINGECLRETIAKGDSMATLEQLKLELSKIITRFDNEKYSDLLYSFEDLQGLVEGEVEEGKDELTKWINEENIFSSLTELVDERLREFYDLCDSWKIWITL